jgi:hypothetical protein
MQLQSVAVGDLPSKKELAKMSKKERFAALLKEQADVMKQLTSNPQTDGKEEECDEEDLAEEHGEAETNKEELQSLKQLVYEEVVPETHRVVIQSTSNYYEFAKLGALSGILPHMEPLNYAIKVSKTCKYPRCTPKLHT